MSSEAFNIFGVGTETSEHSEGQSEKGKEAVAFYAKDVDDMENIAIVKPK